MALDRAKKERDSTLVCPGFRGVGLLIEGSAGRTLKFTYPWIDDERGLYQSPAPDVVDDPTHCEADDKLTCRATGIPGIRSVDEQGEPALRPLDGVLPRPSKQGRRR